MMRRDKRSRRISSRNERRQPKSVATAPYIKRKIPYYEFLGDEGLSALEDQADWLLQEIGIEFRENPQALKLWKQAGADVHGTRVKIPRGMARELCRTIPESFLQNARNPSKTVEIGGDNHVFACVFGPPFVQDLEGGRRYGTIHDLQNLVKIAYSLPSIHHTGLVICEPCDIPVSKRHLDMLYLHMRYNDKPFLGAITEKSRAQDSVDMARILFGEEFMEDHCVIMGNVNTNSPLLVDKVVTEAAEVYCGAGQALIAVPFILSGAMGPATTAASIAQALAEGMAVGAYTQLVRKGSPFILGNFLSSMSLKSGAPTFGMPEPVMSNFIVGQLARRLNVPFRCGGSLTSSKLPDAQAAAESADSMFSTILGGANFVLHSAGWLEGGLVTGYEKLIQDADRLAAYQVMLSGMPVNENTMARDAYLEVEPAGHFLASRHTLRNYETAFFESSMSDNDSFEQWQEHGSLDSRQRAHERWNDILKNYQIPPMDEGKNEELLEFMGRRKSELPDKWY